MGLLKAAGGAIGGVLADQWLEFFVCESMALDVLVTKGVKKSGKRGSNVKGEDNVISNGSGIVVNKGQAAIIVDSGKVAEFCAEPGEYTYNQSSESSIFYGPLGESVYGTLKNTWGRFKYGGIPGKDQRVYYFNTKEILGNKYGTPSPIPYLIVDPNINLRLTISLRANGEYSYRIVDPILFYSNVTGNVTEDYVRSTIDSQLKSEIITVLGPSLGKLGKGLEYHEISFQTAELAEILNEALSAKWREHRGIEIVNFGITCVASPEDEKKIKQLQATAVMRDPGMAAATLVNAQSEAMIGAANNTGGAFTGFLGMGMAGNAMGMGGGGGAPGMVQSLFQMNQQQQQPGTAQAGAAGQQAPSAGQPAADPGAWACACGHAGNAGKFCAECGGPKPLPPSNWDCTCGHLSNAGKFCAECGAAKPAGAWDCACGHTGNAGKFCAECGKPRV